MKTQLSLAGLMLLAVPALAQQTLFSEDFEGPQPAFTLNTADAGSTASGANTWLINDAYTGGSGTADCSGFDIPFTVGATPAQPVGIPSANGHYMHITSNAAIASGILNCCFAAADGFCTAEGNYFARMGQDVNTTGLSGVTLNFWWLCNGGINSYGEVWYSTDQGTTWAQVTAPVANYQGQSSWAQQACTMPAFAGQATLRFGFRFVNGTTLSANDPAFAVDDVTITGVTDVNSVSTEALSQTEYCQGSSIDVPYTATGTWGAGNVFTAELSDSSGSFALPAEIGSVTSTTSGTISAVIPANTPPGSGYLLRVNGSDPATEGTSGTIAITVDAAPSAGADGQVSFCTDSGMHTLLDNMTGASDCGSWTGPSGAPMSGVIDAATANSGGYVYTTNCPGACPQAQATLFVNILQAPDAGEDTAVTLCMYAPSVFLVTLLGGTPEAGGTWTGPEGYSGGLFNPETDSSGIYTYQVEGIPPCRTDTAVIAVTLEGCEGVTELAGTSAGPHWLGQSGGVHHISLGHFRLEKIRLVDAQGRTLTPHTLRISGPDVYIDLVGKAPGMYVVLLYSRDRVDALRLVNRQ